MKQLFTIHCPKRDAGLDSSFELGVLLEKCRYLVKVSIPFIQINKIKLNIYDVYTYKKAEDVRKKSPINAMENGKIYTYDSYGSSYGTKN